MKLKSWLSEERGRTMRLAAHLKVPPSFVSKMASGEKPVPVEHGAAIELFTGGAFQRREYWPESCWRIWPELADYKPNQAPTPAHQALAAINSDTEQGAAHA
jgi:DNA-binding transcriptional regulator YdaS (Cro superfamily)